MTNLTANDPHYGFLKKQFPRGEISLLTLAGDASARRYFRVVVGEESFVLMVWEPFEDEKNYPFLNILKHFEKHGVLVPKVISYSKSEGLVLLEDLGDLTLERKFWESQNQELVLDHYKMAVDELIKIHYGTTADRDSGCVAFQIEFNTQRLHWEMNYAKEHLLEKLLNLRFSEAENRLMDRNFTEICQRLHEEPKYIAHRDYHSRNLMLKTGSVRVIDFQDARLGPVQYDLVSLLKDSYVNLNSKMAAPLLDYYLEMRRDAGAPAVDRESFDRIYELQSVQRCFKACGSFASFFNMRQDTRYLKYLKGTLQRVRQALLIFPERRDLHDLLTDRGLFEMDFTFS